MSGADDLETLRGALGILGGGTTSSTPSCLDDATLAALADGRLGAEHRESAIAHVSTCGRCRGALASVARALADPGVAREVRTLAGGRRRAYGGWAAGLAAAAVLLVALLPGTFQEPARHRAPPITAAPAPEAVWPAGVVAGARSLRWTPVSGADRYRVALFDAAGEVLYQAEVTGTDAALPDSVRPTPGATYWWLVEARVGFDRWASSDLIEFSVAEKRNR